MFDPTESMRATKLAEAFFQGKLNRRQLVEKTLKLGVGATALGAAMSSSGFSGSVLAQDGDEFVVAADGDIDTTDPHISQLLVFNNIIRFNVFAGLVKYAPDLSYVGDLAESWENPDDLTYVFHLRDGLTYHNGQAVEAAHVQSSFERIGKQEKTIWAGRVANIAKYEVVDTKTIKLTLAKVQADFIDGLVPLSIIPPEAEASITTAPIGAGPFKFVSWTPNDNIQLEANPNYYEAGTPGVAKLTFKILTEPQIAITNLQSGDVQAVMTLPVAQAVPLKDSTDQQTIIVPTSGFSLYEMLGKNNATILGNAKVRQALAMCLDKETVKATVYNGEGFPKWSFVPSTHWAYKDEAGYAYDPAGAKAILEGEGVTGLEFSVMCITEYPDGEKTSTIWKSGLEEAGVKLNIDVRALNDWLPHYIDHTYDVIWNAFPGFADPNYFVGFGLVPHLNDGWTNAEAKAIAAAANETLDQAERKKDYDRLQDLVVQDLPVLVIQEAPQASLLANGYTGWEINPLGYVYQSHVKKTA